MSSGNWPVPSRSSIRLVLIRPPRETRLPSAATRDTSLRLVPYLAPLFAYNLRRSHQIPAVRPGPSGTPCLSLRSVECHASYSSFFQWEERKRGPTMNFIRFYSSGILQCEEVQGASIQID